jgi:hypothetical protein
MIEFNANDLVEKIKVNNDNYNDLLKIFVEEATEVCLADANKFISGIMNPNYTGKVDFSETNPQYMRTLYWFPHETGRFYIESSSRDAMQPKIEAKLSALLEPYGFSASLSDVDYESSNSFKNTPRIGSGYKIVWNLHLLKKKVQKKPVDEPKVYKQEELNEVTRGEQKITWAYVKKLLGIK